MKGDYSRFTFDRSRQDLGVLMQQGRVQLDADWNEQHAIARDRLEGAAADIIGPAGAPKAGGGFAVGLTADGRDLTISAGHIHLGGGLYRNEKVRQLTAQPDFRPAAGGLVGFTMPTVSGRYLVYLLAFDRHVTAAEDPRIRETALGGADTATRLRAVWQVRLEAVTAAARCADFGPGWRPSGDATTGRMTAGTGTPPPPEPCLLPPAAAYRGLENQLYRVEVHRDGDRDGATPATFKWSRDNGSVVTTVSRTGQTLAAADLGRDEAQGFAPGQWVEILDARMELHERRGRLLRIQDVNPSRREILIDAATPVPEVDETAPVILRRWDQAGPAAGTEGIPMGAAAVALEAGIEVGFASGSYRSGEYWTIPARTAVTAETGNIEWPRDGAGNFLALRPQGPPDRYCPLALVDFNAAAGTFAIVADCRPRFPALTALEAADIAFDDSVCGLGGAATVQQALDRLCVRQGGHCTVHAGPGDDLAAILGALPPGASARICLRVGDYALRDALRLQRLGHVVIEGSGPGTRLVAATAEAALVLTGCASVAVRDCGLEAGRSGTGTASLEALNGALTLIDCPEVEAERLWLRCAASPRRASTCLTIRHTAYRPGTTRARIQGCRMEVGHLQTGLLAVNLARLAARDNLILPGAGVDARAAVRADRAFRAALRRLLISRIRTGADTTGTNATVTHAGHAVHFLTDPTLLVPGRDNNEWLRLAQRDNPALRSPTELAAFLERAADRMVAEAGTRPDTPARFRALIAQVLTEETPTVGQGIVVGGDGAQEVRLADNSVGPCVQGLHLGVSRRSGDGGGTRFVETASLAGNAVEVRLPASADGERHGIFVGNCRSLRVDGNRVAVARTGRAGARPVDGVLVHGQVDRLVVVRHNHVTGGATRGLAFNPLALFPKPQWIITDNVAEGAQQVVAVTPAAARPLVRGIADNFA